MMQEEDVVIVPEFQQSDPSRGVYGISVAAELTGIAVQSLRLYESRGLLEPDRTGGGTRRYSNDDLSRARRINELSLAGVNLTGIADILHLEAVNAALRAEIEALRGGGGTADSAKRRRTHRGGRPARS